MRRIRELSKIIAILISIAVVISCFGPYSSRAEAIQTSFLHNIKTLSAASEENKVIVWKDPIIENYVREELGKPTGNITVKDVQKITSVSIARKYVNSIDDLKYFYNLEEIAVDNGNFSDISVVKGLPKLMWLIIRRSNVSDISCLKGLTGLKGLALCRSKIQDISSLSGLTNLVTLALYENQIKDISCLKNLTKLTDLYLNDNQISDFSCLKGLKNLKSLWLNNNQNDDIRFIKDMTGLTRVNLGGNQISDVSSLSGLIGLDTLYLNNNNIEDISGLSNLVNLTDLDLKYNQISDLSGLKGLAKLNYLYLDNNRISDIGSLKSLTNLKVLSLINNQITDISCLKELDNLGCLYIEGNQISDWSPVDHVAIVSGRPSGEAPQVTQPPTEDQTEDPAAAPMVRQLILQAGSRYCQVTNPISGDKNVLKKMDSSVTVINKKNMIPVEAVKMMGYEVSWDKKSKTMTLTSEDRTVKLTAGSKTMYITQAGKATEKVTMNAAIQLDTNGKYAISIAGFGKATASPTQWDSKTKNIGINFSKDEFAKAVKTTAAEKELKYRALEYIAGGSFENCDEFTYPTEKLPNGTAVVYSSDKNKASEKKEILKYQSQLWKDDVIYCIGGHIYVARKEKRIHENLEIDMMDFVYRLESGFQSESFVTLAEPISNGYKIIRFDYSKKCPVITDDLKITYDYNYKTKEWVERDTYTLLGNSQQRIRKSLHRFVEGFEWDKGYMTRTYNPMGLDIGEVERYCETGDDSDCRTFQIMENAKGEPAFFINTSKKYGLNATSVMYIRRAVERFNEIDPVYIDLICNRYSLNCLSYDMAGGYMGGTFREFPAWAGTYNTFQFGGVVLINQNNDCFTMDDEAYNRAQYAYDIFVESRALYYRQHNIVINEVDENTLKDPYWYKPGIDNEEADKYACMIAFAKRGFEQKLLTSDEFYTWLGNAEAFLNAYDPSYTMTFNNYAGYSSDYFLAEKQYE